MTDSNTNTQPPPTRTTDRPPGWYPHQGAVNEQAYWDGTEWTGRRNWSGAGWVELPPGEVLESDASPAASRAASGSNRRWLWVGAGIIVAGVVLAVVLILNSTGSTHRSASVTTSTTAPVARSTSTPTSTATSTTASGGFAQIPSEAALEACNADGQSLETALNAYMAQTGSYPAPPAAWSAATYGSNFAPLTSSANGGPYLRGVPATTSFVIEYDSFGHVWVAPPGTYETAYNAGQDFEQTPDICQAAIG